MRVACGRTSIFGKTLVKAGFLNVNHDKLLIRVCTSSVDRGVLTMASRSRGRQFAVQLIYQNEFSGHDLEHDCTLFWDGVKSDDATRAFTEHLVRGVLDHVGELDLEISGYLKGWTLDRIVLMDRLILRLAFYELIHGDDTPWKVVLDEAVLLAKLFSSDKSASFINGVLHSWGVNNLDQPPEPLNEAPAEPEPETTTEDAAAEPKE